MDKVVRNGMVAVAISPGFGAGWTTWNTLSPFEPKIIEMIESGNKHKITEEWLKEQGIIEKDQYCCTLGSEDLEVEWLPEGTAFKINEYDGSESIQTAEDLNYVA